MGFDTPQSAWMREYERLRSDLDNAAYDVGDARNGEDEERAEAVAAMARKALDAHVRGLVEEHERLRVALKKCAGVLTGDFTKRALVAALESARAALAAPDDREGDTHA